MSKLVQYKDEDNNSTLFYARNEYYIGNFMGSVNAVLPEQSIANTDLLSYMYLSYLAIDSGRLVANDIKGNDNTDLLALLYLYEAFEQNGRPVKQLALLTDKVAIGEDETNIWHIATAIVYYFDQQFENALKILHSSNNLESVALSIQCLLRLNRIDLAKQLLTKMQEISDDSTLTQLSQAWINIRLGTQQIIDAYHIFQEFCEKHKSTPLLLNGKATVLIGLERYEEAEALLRDALTIKHNDYISLVNMMVLSHLTGKTTETVMRYWEQLKQFHPKSNFICDLENKSSEFDKICLQYSLSDEDSIINT